MGKAFHLRRYGCVLQVALALGGGVGAWAQEVPEGAEVAEARVLGMAGRVEVLRAGAQSWDRAYTNQILHVGDQVRTREDSQAILRWRDARILRLAPYSRLLVEPPPTNRDRPVLNFLSGILYFFHREKAEVRLKVRGVMAAIRGTEFVVTAAAEAPVVLTVIDGEVDLSNAQGSTSLTGGEQGVVEPGRAPRRSTAVIKVDHLVQWCLYYPGVVDLDELDLDAPIRSALDASLAAYRAGDLPGALERYPAGRESASAAETVYRATLLLAVGEVDAAERLLKTLPRAGGGASRISRLAEAVRRVIAAVTRQSRFRAPSPATATEWMAESYWQQSRGDLVAARRAAGEAVKRSPEFGLAWARQAEMEYAGGYFHRAEKSLERALALSPRNAQAHALQGFVLLGRDRQTAAFQAFERARRLDPFLANAWLGRALVRMRQGADRAALDDLEVAAATEPNRAVLRSYLGKGYMQLASRTWDPRRQNAWIAQAREELGLAQRMDPGDPTAWLYAALLNDQINRPAEAIRDLERSVELNDNRRVYRSRLMLDQDLASRAANLASVYENANLPELSLRESWLAVTYNYGDFSAHRNLAASYDAVRDPTRFNLRHETDWFHETLMANLLAPGGGVLLSQNLSQQNYFRPFERDRLGLATTTEYFSDGEFRQLATQYGRWGNTSYALDLQYQTKRATQPNNDLSRIEFYSQVKQRLTDQDAVFVLAKLQDYESGDNFQHYDPRAEASPNFRYNETQSPMLLAGYHREWSPGVHTLFLGGRLQADQRFYDEGVNQVILQTNPVSGVIEDVSILGLDLEGNDVTGMEVDYRNRFVTYSAELNQVFQRTWHTDILGARFQRGTYDTEDLFTLRELGRDPDFWPLTNYFSQPPARDQQSVDFDRLTLYGYHTWEMLDDFYLTAGLVYDRQTYPQNFRHPPVHPGQARKDGIFPKAALTWRLGRGVTLRGAYSQFLGGTSYDESVRLEPTQLAGFRQAYRSVISESLASSVSAPYYETYGGALDWKLPTRTFLSVEGLVLRSEIRRRTGAFGYGDLWFPPPPVTTYSLREHLDYTENTAGAVVGQVLGRDAFFEARYRFTRAELARRYPDIPVLLEPSARTFHRADLHELRLSGRYQHPGGLFARGEAWWLHQANQGYAPPLAGDDFWQFNLYAGYRLRWRRGEVAVGILNLTDQDYRLNPLSYHLEYPRARTFYLRVLINL